MRGATDYEREMEMNFFEWILARWRKQPATPGIPSEVARAYERWSKGDFANKQWIAEMDYSINSRYPRLFIYDMLNHKLYKYKAAHGQGGRNASPHDGKAREFSNVEGSHMSCLGCFRTGTVYNGANGTSLRLHGLDDTNDNAARRAVVLHKTDYVHDGDTSICGRTWGCIGVDRLALSSILAKLKEGTCLYSHNGGRLS